ncbi:16S rRNA (cytosine(967)-C(5))-methyltransferase RsmB [Anaerotignum lactatifermentans]|uniref:16S rRNA (cytosine(967)-C(5))-methyltransferase n=1 Tax=Anaerotignum lactatifermentans TaxID=160404 RepID=A0ABS2GD45_9FIRM|nr:16S rRNA (cytosine(967)-C(5))-methyltransferase RsmB [Anaerotignum lactatifermentans]MBM6830152.1 16S rRNA (cytosine(967)-C(5))-methyltransferase RsmB [Anaerotignum lactatifermentans]MBM6878703.1 16S rRNA (cytosine(967)-C(5))-methyltransferase RsmB [Anaerotignum lactatifermentans]MBM6951765.1 16S rRNA (cytosine(967)-C(5))-methyltransferase RsmB [Anaerotignum lactatifermentans]
MIQINPREIAAEAMVQIMAEGAYNNGALRRLLRQNGAMSRQDRAFVTEVVNGTLRNLYYVDYILNTISKVRTEKMKPWILAVLRTALYQMYFMHTPDAAACNEAVKLAGERGYAKLGGFVNGVLRSAGRQKGQIALPEKGTAEYLHVYYSHPLWLVKMWMAYYGYKFTEALCRADNKAPDVTIRVNTLKTDREGLKKALEERGVQVTLGKMPHALHLSGTADLGRMDLFLEGMFHVQDESSQAAAALLAPKKGERVLDLCAAPGGKSFTMAQDMENDGLIVARDIYEHKIELIRQGAQRLGIENITAQQRDAALWDEDSAAAFDRVLVDAPCSGLGLLRKKPDIRLKKDGQEIDQLIGIQRQILDTAAGYVKPGGVMVYSTCTLSRKENEKNVQWFLEKHPEFSGEVAAPFLPESMTTEKDSCMVTLFPQIQGTDGFFMARLVKKGS